METIITILSDLIRLFIFYLIASTITNLISYPAIFFSFPFFINVKNSKKAKYVLKNIDKSKIVANDVKEIRKKRMWTNLEGENSYEEYREFSYDFKILLNLRPLIIKDFNYNLFFYIREDNPEIDFKKDGYEKDVYEKFEEQVIVNLKSHLRKMIRKEEKENKLKGE